MSRLNYMFVLTPGFSFMTVSMHKWIHCMSEGVCWPQASTLGKHVAFLLPRRVHE